MSDSSRVGRRSALKILLGALATVGLAPSARSSSSPPATRIVRLSRASFPQDRYGEIRQLLDASQATLVPAVRELEGCLHYYAAIDRETSTMINASCRASLEQARQLDGFPPMLALAARFGEAGVRFERPIANYETLWEI